jgi:hypothetical protein
LSKKNGKIFTNLVDDTYGRVTGFSKAYVKKKNKNGNNEWTYGKNATWLTKQAVMFTKTWNSLGSFYRRYANSDYISLDSLN